MQQPAKSGAATSQRDVATSQERCCNQPRALSVLAREALRPGRFPGTAVSHYKQVHEHGLNYDLEVDTSAASPRQVAQAIVDRLGTPPEAFTAAQTLL